jgi:hypothetical protein
METARFFTRTLMSSLVGAHVFATTLWTTHVVYTVILRVFFGVKEYSSMSADVVIFGMMLGLLYAFGAALGYLISSLIFRVLQSCQPSLLHEVGCALAAALAVYLLALSRYSAMLEFLGDLGVFNLNGYVIVAVPWTLVAIPSTLLIFIVTKAIRKRAARSIWCASPN